MTYETPNHLYPVPEIGDDDWGTDWQDAVDQLDQDVIIKDSLPNRPSAGERGRWFLDTSTRILWYDTGTSWVIAGQPTSYDDTTEKAGGATDLEFGTDLSVTTDGDSVRVDYTGDAGSDTRVNVSNNGTEQTQNTVGIDFTDNIGVQTNGDNTVTVWADDDAATLAGNTPADLRRAEPNLHFNIVELADGQAIRQGITVPSDGTLRIWAWGCHDTDGNSPSGLDLELYRLGSNTVVASASTAWTTGDPIVERANSTTSPQQWVVKLANRTGSDYTDPGGATASVSYSIQ